MIVKKAEVIPVECVVRGYISGSAWAEYRQQGTVNEVPMPKGLRESDPLPEPIFTPATKAESGHDENIHFDRMSEMIGRELAETLREKSLRIYRKASEYMDSKGILLADTKFEFGIHEGRVLLIDEVLTPDSSRFWPKDLYEPGRSQQSFDKQFVRDYLNTKQWDRVPPAPELPIEIIRKTREKYLEIFRIITGTSLTA
jgi:phosphoribosylaminoimidazole-succinocarboxamide synthase